MESFVPSQRLQVQTFAEHFVELETVPLQSLCQSSFVHTPGWTSSLQVGVSTLPQTMSMFSGPARRRCSTSSSPGQMQASTRSSSWATNQLVSSTWVPLRTKPHSGIIHHTRRAFLLLLLRQQYHPHKSPQKHCTRLLLLRLPSSMGLGHLPHQPRQFAPRNPHRPRLNFEKDTRSSP